MPYKVKGKCVYKKDTGKKVGCTKGSVKKYLAALHANTNESIDYELTKEDLEEMIREELQKLFNE
jgi:predicted component of type VI protein secretion system